MPLRHIGGEWESVYYIVLRPTAPVHLIALIALVPGDADSMHTSCSAKYSATVRAQTLRLRSVSECPQLRMHSVLLPAALSTDSMGITCCIPYILILCLRLSHTLLLCVLALVSALALQQRTTHAESVWAVGA